MDNEIPTNSNLLMLSGAQNVDISGDSTLNAVGGNLNVYNISVDTVHNYEPLLDAGDLSRTVHATSGSTHRERCSNNTETNEFLRWITVESPISRVLVPCAVFLRGLFPVMEESPETVKEHSKAVNNIGRDQKTSHDKNGGGTAYGILLKGGSTAQLDGNNVFDIAGFKNSYGIVAEDNSKFGTGVGSNTQVIIDSKPA